MLRLNKFLSDCGVCSRRKADTLITAGRVKVNGKVTVELGYQVSPKDLVLVDDKAVSKEEKIYLLLNKPKGTVSTVSDEKNRRTVLDIVREQGITKRVYPVGRLDFDTSGLLILTNDGDFTNIITHPRNKVEKEYVLRVLGLFPRNLIKSLNQKKYVVFNNTKLNFLKIELNEYFTDPDSTQLQITLCDGKNHQVKNIFLALGYKVISLTRIRIDELNINNIQRGSFRYLKPHEIKKIFSYQNKINRKEQL